MSIDYIGPLELDIKQPSVTWGTVQSGLRQASISGMIHDNRNAQSLQELVTNPDREVFFGGQVGILEIVWTSGTLSDYRGWYLLSSVSVDIDVDRFVGNLYGFSIDGFFLGANREIVITRSARARTNDFSLTSKSLVVQPFWGEDSDGEPFITDPGGTAFAREYDPRTDYDSASPSTTGRSLRIHEGTVT